MSIIIGSIKQETNTFCPVASTLKTFQDGYLYKGEDVFSQLKGTKTEIGGFLDVMNETTYELIPSIAAQAISGGMVTKEAHKTLQNELLQTIIDTSSVDGVLLAMHGAMVSDNCYDTEGETLALIRKHVGEKVPIALSLDPHAHLTEKMIEQADIIVGYKTFPHVDQYNTGTTTASLLVKWLNGIITPRIDTVHLPMLVSPEAQVDSEYPMKDILAFEKNLEEQEDILSVTYFPVQPWLDIPGTASAVLVISNNDKQIAQKGSKDLAQKIWSLRESFQPARLTPEEGVKYALKKEKGPVVLVEPADSMLAGAPGDGVHLLRSLLEVSLTKTCMITIVDPAAVKKAQIVGIGNDILTDIGYSLSSQGDPISVQGKVNDLIEGRFHLQATGVIESMGQTAIIQSGQLFIVVCEYAFSHQDPNSYRALGLHPEEAHILGVKSTLHFQAFYKEIAEEIILLDTPGVSSGKFENFTWGFLSRPMWPLDDITWNEINIK